MSTDKTDTNPSDFCPKQVELEQLEAKSDGVGGVVAVLRGVVGGRGAVCASDGVVDA